MTTSYIPTLSKVLRLLPKFVGERERERERERLTEREGVVYPSLGESCCIIF